MKTAWLNRLQKRGRLVPRKPLNILVMNRQYHQIFGGVEYMSASLVNEMTKRGYRCHLLSLDQEGAQIEYDIEPSIKWHKVSNISSKQKASWKERFQRFKKIRDIIKNETSQLNIMKSGKQEKTPSLQK